MTRKKYNLKFKVKVVLEALKERCPIAEPARTYELVPSKPIYGKEDFQPIPIHFLKAG